MVIARIRKHSGNYLALWQKIIVWYQTYACVIKQKLWTHHVSVIDEPSQQVVFRFYSPVNIQTSCWARHLTFSYFSRIGSDLLSCKPVLSAHTLLVSDHCPSVISGRGRMPAESISWSISTKLSGWTLIQTLDPWIWCQTSCQLCYLTWQSFHEISTYVQKWTYGYNQWQMADVCWTLLSYKTGLQKEEFCSFGNKSHLESLFSINSVEKWCVVKSIMYAIPLTCLFSKPSLPIDGFWFHMQ